MAKPRDPSKLKDFFLFLQIPDEALKKAYMAYTLPRRMSSLGRSLIFELVWWAIVLVLVIVGYHGPRLLMVVVSSTIFSAAVLGSL